MRSLILFALALVCTITAHAGDLKDGRQYALDLGRRLEISEKEMIGVFMDNRDNAPRTRAEAELSSSMITFARIADYACNYAGAFQAQTTPQEIYQLFFDRDPSAEEASQLVQDPDGTYPFFANCYLLALNPQFLSEQL